jgi:bifunctional DNA-binding transcriptional regulator/antitoxin component of YhaV-PrlF toxin-antitoxin module
MSAVSRGDVETVVTPEGSVVVPAEVVRKLSLVPGQRVHVVVAADPRCRNMYGALADKLPDGSPEEIADGRRQAWRDLA